MYKFWEKLDGFVHTHKWVPLRFKWWVCDKYDAKIRKGFIEPQ